MTAPRPGRGRRDRILAPRRAPVLSRSDATGGGTAPTTASSAAAAASILGHWTDPGLVQRLFDCLPQVVLSVKDRAGRYAYMSAACAERCGLDHRDQALGRTAHDLFPRHMADRYAAQDETLFRTGGEIRNSLDLTLLPDRTSGWCLTDKFPLRDRTGAIVGLVCVSRDLPQPDGELMSAPFAAVIDHLHAHCHQPLPIPLLARRARLTTAQFERRMKRIFGVAARQYLLQVRIQAVQRLLRGTGTIAAIAQATGFCDQSALTRRFRRITGLTPRQYRELIHEGAAPTTV